MLDSKIVTREADGLTETEATTVLVVDDSPSILRLYERVLGASGRVIACDNGKDAVSKVSGGGIDVLVSDIAMPGTTGLDLLRAVREFDPDLPVVLVTGRPSVESAAEAIEYGVFRYLAKPFESEGLRSTVKQAARLYQLARIKREALGLAGVVGPSDRAGLEVSFGHALASLSLVYQPIVSASARSIFAYEALMRNTEPAFPNPTSLLGAAERLGAVFELGRRVRRWAGGVFPGAPRDSLLFLNLHPEELFDPELLDPASVLGPIAGRVVLEVTERASLERAGDVRGRVADLRSRGFRIAIDDLGAGYAGLTSFAHLEPEFVKVDMTLTRDIDKNPIKQKLVRSLVGLCRDMEITIIVEGVETTAERDVLAGLGCDLLQGYLYARPGPPFPTPAW